MNKNNIIKKLQLKPGCKYILIIPESAGLTGNDLAELDHEFVALCVMVKTTRGIKVVEYTSEVA